MREGIKMTAGYQIRYMLLVQFAVSGVTFILASMIFWWFLDKPVWKELLSGLFILINAAAIYSQARDFAIQDKKPYTPMKPNKIKGVMMGVVISAVTIIMFIAFKLVWHIWGTPTHLTTWGASIYNFIFSFWTFPYFGIMGTSHGLVTWYSVVMLVLVPMISSTVGYIAGCKGFSILEKIHKLSYEKENKEK